jgi:hypothetical protein
MPSFVQAERNRADRANWAVVARTRADEVRRWLVWFRQEQGWQPGMVWNPYTASYKEEGGKP